MEAMQHAIPTAPADKTAFAALAGLAAGLALGIGLGIFPENQMAISAAIVATVALMAMRPTWAIAVVLAMLPLELFNLQLGPVGLSPTQIAAGMVLTLMAASALTQGRVVVPRTPLDIPILLWVAVGFLGTINSVDPPAALKKAGMTLVLAALYYLIVATARNSRRVMLLLGTFVFAAGVVASYAVWVAYRYIATGEIVRGAVTIGSEGMSLPRAAGAIGNPNSLANLMVLAIPIALVLILLTRTWPSKVAAVVGTGVLAASLLYTFSRGGWFGTFASLVVLAWDRRFRIILLVAALILLTLAPGLIFQRVATSTQVGRPEIANRFDYWEAGLLMFEGRPLFGVGPNNFPAAFTRLPLHETASRQPSHAHNIVINLLAENGMIGLIAYVMLMGVALATFLRRSGPGALPLVSLGRLAIAASIVGSLVQQLTEVLLLEVSLNTVLWVLLAIGVALSDPTFGQDHGDAVPDRTREGASAA